MIHANWEERRSVIVKTRLFQLARTTVHSAQENVQAMDIDCAATLMQTHVLNGVCQHLVQPVRSVKADNA